VSLAGELLLLVARLARSLLILPSTSPRTIASLQPTFRTDLANK
jgi:hypothetical protein